jgi:hypothetical protein
MNFRQQCLSTDLLQAGCILSGVLLFYFPDSFASGRLTVAQNGECVGKKEKQRKPGSFGSAMLKLSEL